MNLNIGWFLSRTAGLVFALLSGAAVVIVVAAVLLGKGVNVADSKAAVLVTSEGEQVLMKSPSSCPERLNTCPKISLRTSTTVEIRNLEAVLGFSTIEGEGSLSATRTTTGWKVELPTTTSTVLVTAADDIWLWSIAN
jgi:hypothetical protein